VPVPQARLFEAYYDYAYWWDGRAFLAPKGFRFAASIPRFFWRVQPPTGPEIIRASLCHDHQYQCPGLSERLSRQEADMMFRVFAREDGAAVVDGLWWAVSRFGARHWRE